MSQEEIEDFFEPTQAVQPSSRPKLDLINSGDSKTPGGGSGCKASQQKRPLFGRTSIWHKTRALCSPAVLGWSPNIKPEEPAPVVLMSQEPQEALVEEEEEEKEIKADLFSDTDIFLATQAVAPSRPSLPSASSTSPSLSLRAPPIVTFSSGPKIDRFITSPSKRISVPKLLGSIYDINDDDDDDDDDDEEEEEDKKKEEEEEDAYRILPTQIQAPVRDIEIDNLDYDVTVFDKDESEDVLTQEPKISKRSPKRVRISDDLPHQMTYQQSSSSRNIRVREQPSKVFHEPVHLKVHSQNRPLKRLDGPEDVIKALTASWPGALRTSAIDQLSHLLHTPTSVFAPVLFHGRSGSGKTEFLHQLVSLVGCVRAHVDCSEISSFRDFFEAIISRLAESAIQCAMEYRGGTLELNAAHLMTQLCSPDRGSAGRACAAALVRWADLPHFGSHLRTSFVTTMMNNFGQTSTSDGDFRSGMSEVFISQMIGQAYCSSIIDFAKELSFLSELRVSDLGMEASPKRIRFEGPTSKISFSLIIDQAERLAAQDPRMVSMLTQLGEWSGSCSVNVIYVTSAPAPVFSSLRECEDRTVPYTIYWAPPAVDTVKSVLLEEASSLSLLNSEGSPSLSTTCRSFVLYIIDTFGDNIGYNLGELRYICRVLWPFYSLPVRAGIIEADEMITLRRISLPFFEHVQRHLLDHDSEPSMASTKAYAAVLSTCGPAAVEKMKKFAAMNSTRSSKDVDGNNSPLSSPLVSADANLGTGGERSLEGELPWFLKFVLIAGFCAGHNPEDTDIRYFSRVSSGRRKAKSSKQFAKKRLRDAMSDGPKPFTLERLLALTHALIASHEGIEQSYQVAHADLTSGIAQLQGPRLLTRVLPTSSASLAQAISSGADEVYRCNLTVGAAQTIAKNIGVDIGKFVHDEAKGI